MDFDVKISGAAEYPERLRMLVGGAPGSGKTRFALTAPNPVWIAARPGMTTLALKGQVPYVDVFDEAQLLGLKKALHNPAEVREEIFRRPIDTVVVDTVDELQRRLIMGRLDKERRSEIKADDWNWIAQRMNKIFDGLDELDVDIIYLTHLKELGGFDDKYVVKPNLQGGFVEQIHGHVEMSLVIKSNCHPDPEVETYVEGVGEDEVEIEIDTPQVRPDEHYLLTKPNEMYEWVNDKTNTLPFYFDLNFEDDFERIKAGRSDVELTPSEESEVDEFVIEVSSTETVKDTKVPGMSTNERVAQILAKKNK